MSIYRNIQTLLDVSDAVSEDQTGSTYAVLPSDGDRIGDNNQNWRVFFDASQSGGATSPTTDVFLETSHDGQTWVQMAQATQLTQDGDTHQFTNVAALGPYVRARTALGGGTNPDHTAKVVLASDGAFRLKLVS